VTCPKSAARIVRVLRPPAACTSGAGDHKSTEAMECYVGPDLTVEFREESREEEMDIAKMCRTGLGPARASMCL
jgi:hypothetical protein